MLLQFCCDSLNMVLVCLQAFPGANAIVHDLSHPDMNIRFMQQLPMTQPLDDRASTYASANA